jgi:diadenosine tetraphosphate (Ap4A) HIT family hydrolase
MPSVFSMIISGDLPGRFVWEDEHCVGFLTINPLTPGHTLVVPREEVDEWTDLRPELWAHLSGVAHKIGQAVKHAFGNTRIGVVIAGYEVPHAHVHVFGADTMGHFDFSTAERKPEPEALDAAAGKIRSSLDALGYQPEMGK